MKKNVALTGLLIISFIIGCTPYPYDIAIGKDSATKLIKRDMNISNLNYKDQWSIGFTNSDKAWSLVNQKTEIKVAVVDSGVDYNNADLKNRVLKNVGYNFVNNTNDAMDDYGHGTEVAGIIAAQGGNDKEIIGIAGPLDVKIIPVKVLGKDGLGYSDIIAKGIVYAADVGADIINVSIDLDVHDKNIENALLYAKEKGSFIVVAAGNSNSNCDVFSPAGDDGAFTVASIGATYKKSYFSNYGTSVQVAAPGENILTTQLGGKYGEISGTSMAAPVVAGIAAMIKAENPLIDSDEIAKIIDTTATDVMKKGKDMQTGYGLINAYEAIKNVKKNENI